MAYVRRAADGRWTTGDPVHTSDRTSEQLLNEVGSSVRALKPANDVQLSIWNDARDQYQKVLELRSHVEQAEGSIPAPMLGIVIAWLILVFAGFGYRAPRNFVVVICLWRRLRLFPAPSI